MKIVSHLDPSNPLLHLSENNSFIYLCVFFVELRILFFKSMFCLQNVLVRFWMHLYYFQYDLLAPLSGLNPGRCCQCVLLLQSTALK